MSFVAAGELGRTRGWVERIEQRELCVDLLVCEDDHGELLLAVDLTLAAQDPRPVQPPVGLTLVTPPRAGSAAAAQLREYLAGDRTAFDLRVGVLGSAFEQAAWRALTEIPHGQTRSYAEQAAAMGRPSAARAVGRANGRNRAPIVVPCHRVIGSDGSLTGFAGGLVLKRWLLIHEGVRLAAPRVPTPTPHATRQGREQLGLFA